MFGDVMMEVDWSVGEILDAIKRNNLDDNTLVIFTADNGPWLSYGTHAGSASPLREGKGTMFEGGYREPTIMRWPGKIPANTTCDQLASTIDIFPTVAKLIDAKPPTHRIDGKDIRPLMFGEANAKSPHEAFYCYYHAGELHAVRNDRFKLHFPHRYRTLNGRKGRDDGMPVDYEQSTIGNVLYDLKNDIGETTDVSDKFPDVVKELQRHAEIARKDLGDKLTKTEGSGLRKPGQIEQPKTK